VAFMLTAPAIITGAAAVVTFTVAVMGWRRRNIPGGTEFSLMMAAVFIWEVTSTLGGASAGVQQATFFAILTYAGSIHVSPLFLLFALRYRDHSWQPSWWQAGLLWLIPAVTLILAMTSRWNHLIWTGVTPSPIPGANLFVFSHGPWFYIAVAYYAALGVVAAFVLGRAAWRAQRMFVSQTVILLAGLLIPWVFSAVYVLSLSPLPGLDLPCIGFAFTGLLVIAGIRRFRFLDLVPVARHFLVESMADGLLVLDAEDQVVDVNPAARALLGNGNVVIGGRVDDIPGELGAAIAGLRGAGVTHREMSLPGDPERFVDMRLTPLLDRSGQASGGVILIHDLSERRRMELERERLISDLQAALNDVRILRGLLPICASCKKIRDDKGYWGGLEKYIMEHSEAQFSHGICPECMGRLYPGLVVEDPA
jgi:PAS domain-containing protein